MSDAYLACLLASDYWQQFIMTIQAGASRQALNFQQIRALVVPMPPIELQEKFAERLWTIKDLEGDCFKASDDTCLLSESLSATCFNS